jgi:hypothetical protein
MERSTNRNSVFRCFPWVLGISILLVGGGGLELFAQASLAQKNITTALLTVYLASWSYALGLLGLVVLAVVWSANRLTHVPEPIDVSWCLAREQSGRQVVWRGRSSQVPDFSSRM